MDFANRGNRPVQQQSAPQMSNNNEGPSAPVMPSSTASKPAGGNKGSKVIKIGASILLVCIAVLLIASLVGLIFGDNEVGNQESELVKSDKYQAVFLNSQDGQVYFGKLGIYNDEMYALTDIYYVRVENPIQPEGANQTQQPNISLAKLGNELHGPEDVMFIRRDKVLYWENLKDDGQVVKAITEYKANGGKDTQTNTQTQTQQTTDDTTSTEETQNP